MELATGAMGTLLPRLAELAKKEYVLQKSVKEGIAELKSELEYMLPALERVSEVPADELDPQVMCWANDIRQLSYAIEDNLDSFLVSVQGLEANKHHSFMGFLKKARDKVTKFKTRHEIAKNIIDIESRVRKVKERYDRYKVDDIVANLGTKKQLDPRLLYLYNNVSNIVGIDKATDEVIKMLSEDDDKCEKKLMKVSVVGLGGLGKTTLARAVYEKLKKKFDCASFVPVGRKPDMEKVLKDILFELDKEKYKKITESKKDERQLIDELRGFLEGKRYMIYIDDIWDLPIWEMIKCALEDSNTGSRIITTTRICEVAEEVGCVYNIKPLSNEDSKKLFYSRIFGGEGTPSDNQSVEVSDKILRKCGGVPLSIITMASLLVGKKSESWYKVYESIGFVDGKNKHVLNARKILSFSYYDLPPYLKPCLLYLSLYPEDMWIEINQLIWMWVAEGLIVDEGEGLFKVGESYFNQLVNKSMIQLGDRGRCEVHDMVLDLIRSISSQVNFTTVYDVAHRTSSASSTSSPVRRWALHGRSTAEDNNPSTEMEHVRSFNGYNSTVPDLLSFKVISVLVLQQCYFSAGGRSLEHLGKLVRLRYLGLRHTSVTEIPGEIGHDLKFLETLDVRQTGIQELPPSVDELSRLMCLCASDGTRMMGRIGKLTSLEELMLSSVDKSPDFFKELGNLTKVRVLDIEFDEIDESMQMALLESLGNMHKIRSLKISCTGQKKIHFGGWDEWVPHSELSKLGLPDIKLPRMPSWMDSFHLPQLSYLWLDVEDMDVQDMQILGRLPSLRFLFLYCVTPRISYTVGRDEFRNLRSLSVGSIEIICGEGALPMLHDLRCFAIVGMEDNVALVPANMPCLQEVTYHLKHALGTTNEEVEEAETVLTQAAQTHPNRPTVKILLLLARPLFSPDSTELTEIDMFTAALWQLGRTVMVLTMGQSNVHGEDVHAHRLSSMLSCVLDNNVVRNLLSYIVSQRWMAIFGSPVDLKSDFELCARYPKIMGSTITGILEERTSGCQGDRDLPKMMKQMMPAVSQVLAGVVAPAVVSPSSTLPPVQPQHNVGREPLQTELDDLRYMLWQLGRTIMVLTMGESNVDGEEAQRANISSMLSSVLYNSAVCNLVSNLASQRTTSTGSDVDFRSTIESYAKDQEWLDLLISVLLQNGTDLDNTSLMQRMMPVVSQVLVGLLMQPQHNDGEIVADALADNLDQISISQVVNSNEEASPGKQS